VPSVQEFGLGPPLAVQLCSPTGHGQGEIKDIFLLRAECPWPALLRPCACSVQDGPHELLLGGRCGTATSRCHQAHHGLQGARQHSRRCVGRRPRFACLVLFHAVLCVLCPSPPCKMVGQGRMGKPSSRQARIRSCRRRHRNWVHHRDVRRVPLREDAAVPHTLRH
jgi:hypothetical protein